MLVALERIIDQACDQGCPEYGDELTKVHTEECQMVRALLREIKEG